MATTTDSSALRKPRLALFIATGLGLGYLPKAPGTWGSLGGIALALSPHWILRACALLPKGGLGIGFYFAGRALDPFVLLGILLTLFIAAIGVMSATRAQSYIGQPDPQNVVIDEISGQQLTLLLGGFVGGTHAVPGAFGTNHPLGVGALAAPNWKYLLLGFILFRVFDIWKPFPARQAERLPGGWGILADDWVAGIYAALGLWAARALGL